MGSSIMRTRLIHNCRWRFPVRNVDENKIIEFIIYRILYLSNVPPAACVSNIQLNCSSLRTLPDLKVWIRGQKTIHLFSLIIYTTQSIDSIR